jgi:hypothetical protein
MILQQSEVESVLHCQPLQRWHHSQAKTEQELNYLSMLLSEVMFFPTWGQFNQHSTSSFYACRSQKRKKTLIT